ncbi:MAG: hypothetical protein HUK22_00615, partial [Thermoguttaceae bacterium]|nr:hypothetical protein [Thermoguttaceae bacterium]
EGATVEYVWYRVADDGLREEIPGATDASYTTVSADEGYYIGVYVLAYGEYVGEQWTVTKDVVKAEAAPISLESVELSTKTPKVGETITATVSPEGATVEYVWYRVDVDGSREEILGATGASYTTASADEGFAICVRVTAVGVGYVGTLEANTAKVAPAAPIEKIDVATLGLQLSTEVPVVGSAISVEGVPAAADLEYVWYKVTNASKNYFEEIPGVKSSSLSLTDDLIDYRIAVEVVGRGDYCGTVDLGATINKVKRDFQALELRLSTDAPVVGGSISVEGAPSDASAFSYVWYRVYETADGKLRQEQVHAGKGEYGRVYENISAVCADSQLRVVVTGKGDYSIQRETLISAKAARMNAIDNALAEVEDWFFDEDDDLAAF